ncbi:MAG: hypothetical protein KKA07_12135 [Bacteroidetes bacterium]|nr:hypothetical protein [Bacteroidota bacterium]MBU1719807.1 hypothetical protein [Bacteroidota bacterium]
MKRLLAFLAITVVFYVPHGSFGQCTVYDTTNSKVPDNVIKLLLPGQGDDVWFATGDCFSGGVLSHFDGHTFEFFDTTNSPLPDKFITALCFGDKGDLVIGTKHHGVAIKSKDSWHELSGENSQLPDNHINCLHFANHVLYVGTPKGLLISDRENQTVITSELPANEVTSIAHTTDGAILVGTTGGYAVLSDGKWEIITKENSQLPDNTIHQIAVDPVGNIWIVFFEGIAKISNGMWKITRDGENGYPAYTHHVIDFQQDSALWVATNFGIAHLENGSWKMLDPENSCIPDYFNNQLMVGKNGVIWIASQSGLVKFKP